MALLTVRNLRTEFATPRGVVRAVNGIDFDVEEGEVLAIVGESGSGKSVAALSIIGLLPGRSARVAEGEIRFGNQDLTKLSPRELCRIRGSEISMVFQNPLTALDPSFRVGKQLAEVISLGGGAKGKAAEREATEYLARVGIRDAERVLRAYPHELSGGMRQRVVIAMAVSRRPKLIIADEPTTALDATIQKQILGLLRDINRELGTSIIVITHDFGVVANLSDKAAVMYAGHIVEHGRTADLIADPRHPYTRGLIGSVPDPGLRHRFGARRRLAQIEGSPPDLLNAPACCAFAGRCPEATVRCRSGVPEARLYPGGRRIACFEREAKTHAAAR
ncbi:ABC transporter ATP-binding protein [Cohnella massiliensis]|uniref:ABC transporter ATP-binding protein n=1 Tax=Cohnella massiliensis TaxID=1816691 RepID=UPI0009B972AD|nr:ABC transporter ATP-binding protein [Cohnella massiliensis]